MSACFISIVSRGAGSPFWNRPPPDRYSLSLIKVPSPTDFWFKIFPNFWQNCLNTSVFPTLNCYIFVNFVNSFLIHSSVEWIIFWLKLRSDMPYFTPLISYPLYPNPFIREVLWFYFVYFITYPLFYFTWDNLYTLFILILCNIILIINLLYSFPTIPLSVFFKISWCWGLAGWFLFGIITYSFGLVFLRGNNFKNLEM